MIPLNVIAIWTGTHAAIPTGWVRVTDLDSKYTKGAAGGSDPNDTGGNATHAHSSPSHSHTLNSHTHTYTLPATTLGNEDDNTSNNVVNDILRNNHSHAGTSGASSGGTISGACAYGAFSNDPPYTDVIFVRSLGNAQPAAGIVFLTNQATIPDGWQNSDGSAGSTDLRNTYLKGAGTGADAGGTGGTTTDSHDITHSHSTTTHTHIAANSGGQSGGDTRDGNVSQPWDKIRTNHVHSVSLDADTQDINQNTDTLVTSETVEPAYTKLMALHNKAGARIFVGMIAMWLETIATIPQGWKLCDGSGGTPEMRERYLKIANNSGEIEDTGGSNTHTHAAQAHSHTSNGSHTHGIAQQAHTVEIQKTGNGAAPARNENVHAATTSAGTTASYAAANTTANSSNNEPPYRTVAFIQYKFPRSGMAQVI